MENEKYQQELFEFEAQKKPVARFGNILQRADFAITLTPEKMVFAAIGVMMLMVVFFALGVEKGKAAAYIRPAAPATQPKIVASAPVQPKPVIAAANITPKTSASAASAKAPTALDRTRPYTIVAAAFSREDFASKEVGKLKASGLDAFVYYGEPYYLACVGSFQNKDAAGKILKKVKEIRRDAYVRMR